MLKCQVCGKEIEKSRYAKSTICSSDCFTKNYWNKIVESYDDPRRVIIDGKSFYIEDENPHNGLPKGFGGRKFIIARNNGIIIETTNLWAQGEVPDEYRSVLKDNAQFLNDDLLYLDSAATTKPLPEVMETMKPYFNAKWYNPSSLYMPAMQVKKAVEKARETIAEYINAEPDEIYFTSGGSEGNCWALQSNQYSHIITTHIEHKSILALMDDRPEHFAMYVDVDSVGHVQLYEDEFKFFHGKDKLMSVQFANNEIGTIQDMKSIVEYAKQHEWVVHTDAVQAFGQVPIDVKALDVDMMTVSGHKFGCPKGIGFLYIKNGTEVHPLIYGTQNGGMRGGTENVPYIMGMAKAVELLKTKDINHIQECRDKLIEMLIHEGFVINGEIEHRLSNNVSATIPIQYHVPAETMIYALANRGIFISAGSACNSHGTEPSHVLTAIGLDHLHADSTIRISLPDDIKGKDIDRLVFEIKRVLGMFKT